MYWAVFVVTFYYSITISHCMTLVFIMILSCYIDQQGNAEQVGIKREGYRIIIADVTACASMNDFYL